jgi:steroid delta-isomerase-like uncharacterized protein
MPAYCLGSSESQLRAGGFDTHGLGVPGRAECDHRPGSDVVITLVVARTNNDNRGSFTMIETTEQNKAVIRHFFDAWNSRQPDAFDDLVAPDVVRHCEATPGMEARSLDQVKEFLRQDTAIFPDSVQTIKLLVAEGDLVAAWTTCEGTQQGPMGPFPPSGRKAQFDFGAMFRMAGGKIAEWWVTWDNVTILRALGHLPSG